MIEMTSAAHVLLALVFRCQQDFGNETVTDGHSMCRYLRAVEKFVQRNPNRETPAPSVTTETASEFLGSEKFF